MSAARKEDTQANEEALSVIGGKFKDTYIASHQPSLEEEAAPAPERTKDWVHMSKFEDSRKEDLQQDYIEQKVSKSVIFDEASG